jgi:trans-2,3-dihydro-3-hydroxyanthranilate isomerase
MDTRDALVVDAYAPEPMTGTPVGVVLDGIGLAEDQRERIAIEFGAPVTAFVGEVEGALTLRIEDPVEAGRPLQVGVAVAAALRDRDRFDGETVTLGHPAGELSVGVDIEGRVWVEVDEPDLREADVTEAEAAGALGVDSAAIRDVAADLPLVRASLGRGVLAVPVNFLEHLSGATPDLDAVAELLERTGAACLFGYSFDTLSRDRDVHGLAVDAEGVVVSPRGDAAACAAAAVRRHGALDHDRETLHFETGDLLDRPARLSIRTGEAYAVGGRAVTVLDGRIVVPPGGDSDEIIEV